MYINNTKRVKEFLLMISLIFLILWYYKVKNNDEWCKIYSFVKIKINKSYFSIEK